MSRRLANEAIRDEWDALGIEHFVEDNTIYIPVNKMYTNNEELLILTYGSTYPFRGPHLLYKGKNLLLFYRDLSQISHPLRRNDMTHFMGGDVCMCCKSLLCGNNWNVHHTIKNLLDEFIKFRNIYKRCVERFWSYTIASRYLVEDIPIYQYL